MAEWFYFPVIWRLKDEARSLLREEAGHLHPKMGDLLSRLIRFIQPLIEYGQSCRARDLGPTIFSRQLKNTLYDAEDVLDEIQCKILFEKMNGGKKGRRLRQTKDKKVWRISSYFMNSNNSVSFHHDLQQLEKLVGTLETTIRRGSIFVAHPEEKTTRVRETTSYIIREDVVGRTEEKEMIVKILLSSGGEPKSRDKGRVGSSSGRIFDVLPLVGMGGVGKTTLAKLVYNDDGVKKHFDTRLWCYVSDDFDVGRILRSLLCILSNDLYFNICDLSDIETKLKLALSNKKFLIVFDDVWIEEPWYWEALHDILTCGARGSKVVVTTRSELVADIVGTMSPIMVNILSKNECWEIIKDLAFGVRHVKHEERKKLQQIGMQICEKAAGLPLAAKVLGDLLQTRLDENSWRAILAGEWWELDFVSGGILPTLKLSYQHLNGNLKECFAYCSIFPRGHQFEKQKLVQMWRAQGYIKLGDRERRTPQDIMNKLEDIGSRWFDELKSGCFFKSVEGGGYVMHDLMRALAISVSLDDCVVVEDGSEDIPHRIRHLAVMTTGHLGALKEIRKFESLRTILFFGNYDLDELSKILEDIFIYLKNLRVLDLSSAAIEELPNTIGGLSHLRYLDIASAKIVQLPTSFWGLHRLQVLFWQGYDYQELAEGMDLLQINPSNSRFHSLSPHRSEEDSFHSLSPHRSEEDSFHPVRRRGFIENMIAKWIMKSLKGIGS